MKETQNTTGHLFLTREDDLKLPAVQRDALCMVVAGDALTCICTLIQSEGRSTSRPLALDILWAVRSVKAPGIVGVNCLQ